MPTLSNNMTDHTTQMHTEVMFIAWAATGLGSFIQDFNQIAGGLAYTAAAVYSCINIYSFFKNRSKQ